jgi:hypothetical protein
VSSCSRPGPHCKTSGQTQKVFLYTLVGKRFPAVGLRTRVSPSANFAGTARRSKNLRSWFRPGVATPTRAGSPPRGPARRAQRAGALTPVAPRPPPRAARITVGAIGSLLDGNYCIFSVNSIRWISLASASLDHRAQPHLLDHQRLHGKPRHHDVGSFDDHTVRIGSSSCRRII